jgi:Right handed beta helix region
VDSATGQTTVCLAAGSYGALDLSGTHTGMVTIEPTPNASASVAGVSVAEGASDITIHNFVITGGVSLGAGDSHITIDHNDIDGEGPGGDGEGVETGGVNCAAPNAPVYVGCTSTPPSEYITISGNRIHGYGAGETEDAIHLNNWHHVLVLANDIYNLEEHGNHTDALQSVWGGSDLVFERNYEHDNQSQGFFIRDGDASQVKVADNLFLRNNNLGGEEYNVQVIDTTGFTMTGNTVWDDQADLIRAEEAAEPLTATVERNVEQLFGVLEEGGPLYQLSEDYDIFAEAPWTFTPGPHSVLLAKPEFADPAADDYRLKSNPEHIGVDWAPSEYIYGPTGE